MNDLLRSWLSVASIRSSVATSYLTVAVASIVGCDVPNSVEVSRGSDGKVNVTSTHIDVTYREAPAEANENLAPAGERPENTDAAKEPSTTEDAEAAAPANEQVAVVDSEEKSPRVFSSSRAPSRPGEAEKISFDDLVIGLQADVVFRPWMMGDRPKELDGKKVRISGFMHAGADPVKTKEFVLLRNLECKFGPGGQADHLAQVYMKPGITTNYPGKDPIKVEGTLKIEPFVGTDGNTWSLYRIEDAEVVR